MEVIEGSDPGRDSARGCVLTVGNFDGLHLGHRALLEAVRARGRELGRPTAVYTFDPHPRRVLFPEQADSLRMLMTWEQLAAGLEESGVDVLVRETFTPAFAALSPDEFLRDVIAERLAPRELFVGRDFHFGKGRSGSGEMLAARGPALGIRVAVLPQVCAGGEDVSSTRIREALLRGDLADARLCLGRPYTVWGRVVEGDRRGRTLGFPTANLGCENELVPANGVYATRVRVFDAAGRLEAKSFESVTNVGTRPTFAPGRVLVEAHLFDFAGDLYGRRLELAFHQRIRAERRFSGPDELARQIAADAAQARQLLRAETESA
ncbi:MAG TPA: bifunctional riboflavin kinase/FAD synthetase [Myxococcota bacterium]|nr:bifunctional riboflavin kinase/FAD synthetase [Myxococcota bacterium]